MGGIADRPLSVRISLHHRVGLDIRGYVRAAADAPGRRRRRSFYFHLLRNFDQPDFSALWSCKLILDLFVLLRLQTVGIGSF